MKNENWCKSVSDILTGGWMKKSRRRRSAFAVIEALESRELLAAVVELVQDFDTTPASSGAGYLPVTMNGISFFAAIDESHGQELCDRTGPERALSESPTSCRGLGIHRFLNLRSSGILCIFGLWTECIIMSFGQQTERLKELVSSGGNQSRISPLMH